MIRTQEVLKVMLTAGDVNVPVNTGIAMGRVSGHFGFARTSNTRRNMAGEKSLCRMNDMACL